MYGPPGSPFNPNCVLQINEQIIHELLWFLHHFKATQGLYLFNSIAWTSCEADFTFYTDALLTGIGMWLPELCVGYYTNICTRTVDSKFFYFKAFVVTCAIYWAPSHLPLPKCIAIFTDNMNMIDILNSMRAHGKFNKLLKYVVDLLMVANMDI